MASLRSSLKTVAVSLGLLLGFPAIPGNALGPPEIVAPSYAHPFDLYGEEIVFDVYRKDTKIGSHRVGFSQAESRLTVTATSQVRINFLFFTAYRFDYNAREIWQDGRLVAMTSSVDDNGKKGQVEALGTEDGFRIQGPHGAVVLDAWIFPTNHWNRAQVAAPAILNSITGRPARVETRSLGFDAVATAGGTTQAERFEYTGELRDTHVWYDRGGRWVKMSFKAKDGSWIEYRCVRCAPDHPRIASLP